MSMKNYLCIFCSPAIARVVTGIQSPGSGYYNTELINYLTIFFKILGARKFQFWLQPIPPLLTITSIICKMKAFLGLPSVCGNKVRVIHQKYWHWCKKNILKEDVFALFIRIDFLKST